MKNPDPALLDRNFAALADPTRRAILLRLAKGEAGVMELAAPFAMSQPAVTRHIKVLTDAGLITRRKQGTKHLCRLSPDGLDNVAPWLTVLGAAMRANYDRLDTVLTAMESGKDRECPR